MTNDQLAAVLAERVMRWTSALSGSSWPVGAGYPVGGFSPPRNSKMPFGSWRRLRRVSTAFAATTRAISTSGSLSILPRVKHGERPCRAR
jgi:hypothetical protein